MCQLVNPCEKVMNGDCLEVIAFKPATLSITDPHAMSKTSGALDMPMESLETR